MDFQDFLYEIELIDYIHDYDKKTQRVKTFNYGVIKLLNSGFWEFETAKNADSFALAHTRMLGTHQFDLRGTLIKPELL